MPTPIGLDLSLTASGVSTPSDTFTVTTRTGPALEARLVAIRETVVRSVLAHPDPVVFIEELPVGPQSTPKTIYLLGLVHSQIRVELYEAGIPVVMVMPSVLKKYATGKGNAAKSAVILALYKRTGLELADDNQVDAYWLRAMGAQALGEPLIDVPAAHTAGDGWNAFTADLEAVRKRFAVSAASRPAVSASEDYAISLGSVVYLQG